MSQDVRHQVDNVSNADSRSVEILRHVMSLEVLIANMVQEMDKERRSRETVAAMTTKRVNRVGREALLATMGNKPPCHKVDDETPNKWMRRMDTLLEGRDWRPRRRHVHPR